MKKLMIWAVLFVCPFAATAAHYRHDGVAVLNDLTATPGKANVVLTQAKLCSASFRTGPYRKVEESTKKQACAEYGVECSGKKVEIDHLISLEVGGSNDLANLWPEPYQTSGGAKQKDVVENELHKMVCSGSISLKEAQKCIATDWYSCAKRLKINTEISNNKLSH